MPWQWTPHPSEKNYSIALAWPCIAVVTTSPSSLVRQLLTGCLASPQSQSESTAKWAALLLSNSVTALPVIQHRLWICHFPSCQNATLPQPRGHHLTGQKSGRGTHSVFVTAGRRGTSTMWPASNLPPAACTQISTSGLGANPEHRQKGLYSFP